MEIINCCIISNKPSRNVVQIPVRIIIVVLMLFLDLHYHKIPRHYLLLYNQDMDILNHRFRKINQPALVK
jgi:hypothetical protein